MLNQNPLPATPAEIIDIAVNSEVVEACFNLWRNGTVSWEQAMMLAVRELAHSNEVLKNNLYNEIKKQKFIVIKKEEG